jgi:hypothetical protein
MVIQLNIEDEKLTKLPIDYQVEDIKLFQDIDDVQSYSKELRKIS